VVLLISRVTLLAEIQDNYQVVLQMLRVVLLAEKQDNYQVVFQIFPVSLLKDNYQVINHNCHQLARKRDQFKN